MIFASGMLALFSLLVIVLLKPADKTNGGELCTFEGEAPRSGSTPNSAAMRRIERWPWVAVGCLS
jgi:hypothetical protein